MPKAGTRVAHAYDRLRAYPPEVAGRIATAIGNALQARGEEPVLLELGAGTGRIALPLIARGYRYIALDRDPAMLEVFRQKAAGVMRKVHLLLADAREIPLPGESVHGVIAVHLWHLLPDWQRALAEAFRVLKPGGVLLEGWDRMASEVDSRLQERWQALVAAEGVRVERGRHQKRLAEVAEALRRLGLRPRTRLVVAWREERSLREALEALEERLYSFTQEVPEEVHRRAMPHLLAFAEAEFGSLDRTFPVERSFFLRISRLG
ncbi:class I SAM-dependent methyltransferase [Thermus thermamylovorans]|uniref:Class I SAM-dependent methyltransferase n=1 Tax=Thermus thermamylovorans TaxID=2509362 RepID=A0A4V2IV43_9DEIN|nr:class I SAM-dependent methyltransferase [Thermus thermamylovorans]TBH20814.1 class I SAM-dependent methyltransferase [Thermus thermamylovorans]